MESSKSTLSKSYCFFLFLCVILFFSLLLSISSGATSVSLRQIINILTGQISSESTEYNIVMFVRLPRTAAAVLSGAALSVSGAILQTVLGNSMASPNVIGVNSGAGLGATLCMWLFPGSLSLFPIGAFIGALLTALIVYAIASKTGASKTTIVLTGLAIGSVLSAGINAINTLHPDVMIGSNSFRMGGFSFITPDQIKFAAPYIIFGLIISLFLSYELNLLTLGDEMAKSLGLSVKLYRFIFITLAALLAGAAVSFAGLLGFVGLIVPHISKIWTSANPKLLIPCSLVGGGAFVLLCDTITRILFAPYEFPVGIVMSFLGGPFFIWLLVSRRRTRND